MMTACDLSAITKPWEIQSKVAPRRPTLPNAVVSPDSLFCPVLMVLGRSDGGSRVLGAGRP